MYEKNETILYQNTDTNNIVNNTNNMVTTQFFTNNIVNNTYNTANNTNNTKTILFLWKNKLTMPTQYCRHKSQYCL